jgi:hypothetical protein
VKNIDPSAANAMSHGSLRPWSTIVRVSTGVVAPGELPLGRPSTTGALEPPHAADSNRTAAVALKR